MSFPLIRIVLFGLLLFPLPARANPDPSRVCALEAARAERALAIPAGLLDAIAIVESGRWDADRRASFAWPWSITAEGKGQFLPSKAAAIAEVKRLRAQGVRNIDVGCMQVNLHHHAQAFASLDEAFDPTRNMDYAARFLTDLYEAHGSWPVAAGRYHSATPVHFHRYQAKVLETWNDRKNLNPAPTRLAKAEPLTAAKTQALPPPRPNHLTPASEVAQAIAAAQKARDESRAQARAQAEAYRQAKLEEYRLRKLERQANKNS